MGEGFEDAEMNALTHFIITFFAVIAALFAHDAYAGEADLSWVGPTLNTDGTPYTDRGGFKVKYGQTAGAYPNVDTLNDPAATGHTVTGLTDGAWYFVVTAFDTSGNESDNSGEAQKNVTGADDVAPAPPTDLTVASLTVYTISKRKDGVLLVAAGTVPGDTACDPLQRVNGHYAVPSDLVTWAPSVGTPRPLVVVANCS